MTSERNKIFTHVRVHTFDNEQHDYKITMFEGDEVVDSKRYIKRTTIRIYKNGSQTMPFYILKKEFESQVLLDGTAAATELGNTYYRVPDFAIDPFHPNFITNDVVPNSDEGYTQHDWTGVIDRFGFAFFIAHNDSIRMIRTEPVSIRRYIRDGCGNEIDL